MRESEERERERMEGKRRRKENAAVRAAWKMDAAQEFLEVKLKNSFDGIWSETAANTKGSHPKSPQSMGGTHLSAQRGGGGNGTTDVQIAADKVKTILFSIRSKVRLNCDLCVLPLFCASVCTDL